MKKMKKMKQLCSILLVMAMLVMCISACGSKPESGNEEGSSPASENVEMAAGEGESAAPAESGGEKADVPPLKGPGNVTLKRLGYNVAWDPTSDLMVDVLKESTGYDVEYFILPAENADEKLVMEVSGGADYDIIQCSPNQFQTLMGQGALVPLNDLLEAYGPNILAGVTEESWRACSDEDGNIYGIPYKYPYAQEIASFMACRWDMMREAGIESMPATIDEFYDCLVTLKEYYGDEYIIFSGPYRAPSEGNGTWIFPRVIAAAFGIYNDWMVDENGKVYYMTEAEGFTDMIEFLTKCNNEGLLDPDWAVNTSTTVCEKFAGGKAIIVQMNRNGLGTTVPAMLETLGIGYEDLSYVNALKGSDGTCKYMRTEAINFVTVVLRSSENAADAINWIDLKQQEQLFLNIGVEGTHFNYDENDGSILPINPIFSDERGNSYWYLDSTNEEEFATQWPARIRKSQAQWEGFEATTLYANEHMPEIFVNNDFAFKPATEKYSKYNTALFSSLNDYILQIMAGTKTLDDLGSFQSDWAAAGGDEVREELQAWYTSFYN